MKVNFTGSIAQEFNIQSLVITGHKIAAISLGIPLETDEGNKTTLAVCLNVKV